MIVHGINECLKMSELQLFSFKLLVVDDLVIPLFSVICVSAGIAKHCSKTLKETAYTSLVSSILDYSSTVWDPYLQKEIESIQRRAMPTQKSTNWKISLSIIKLPKQN
jgi:hypothetical protein